MVVFSVFNIGTGHTQNEPNNTMKALYDDCNDAATHKYINDGPTGLSTVSGWGMNDMLGATMAMIKGAQPIPTRVNLAGHSRGAVLCHMLARAIFSDPQTRHMEITLALIDPVHMSKVPHDGADDLDRNARLLAYQAIIMENENTRLPFGPGGKFYPFNFVGFDGDAEGKKIHYINMPGTHGSATQVLTNPIGKVGRELVANFMRKRGTSFQSRKKQPIEMCELFAQIHLQNPLNAAGTKRKIFDDAGTANIHVGKEKWQSFGGRDYSVKKALQHNQAHRNPQFPKRGRINRPDEFPYFINDKHAKFFSVVFPKLWSVVKPLGFTNHISGHDFVVEMLRMHCYPALRNTSHMVEEMIPDGAVR